MNRTTKPTTTTWQAALAAAQVRISRALDRDLARASRIERELKKRSKEARRQEA